MKAFLLRVRSRVGDFWWYSLMIFLAARAADVLNVFVGLWIVPRYVDPSELGAVLPLTQFASFFAIPIAVFAATFRNELTTLASNRKFGQMKALMRSVFIAAAILFFAAVAIVKLVMPLYLERIHVAEGSLVLAILVCSFAGAISPIFTNALQSLKKFRAQSVVQFFGAPIRILTMIATMPFRALTGYFAGQTSVSAFTIVASVIALRKELSVPAEPYWNREIVRRFGRLFLILALGSVASGLTALVESTILRQRLPELDSAAYYLVTRFSEIASFLAMALSFTIFPYTAELAASGKDTRPIVLKAALAIFATNGALAVFFCVFGQPIIGILPHGSEYAGYSWAIPWMIAVTTFNWVASIYTTGEVSAFRFGYLKWWFPLHIAYAALLLAVTGYGYFTACLPASWTTFFAEHNISSLSAMLWWMSAFSVLKTLGCAIAMRKNYFAIAK